MNQISSKTVELNASHDLNTFDCGVPELNSWLMQAAISNQKSNISRTFVLVENSKVVAFYCLAAGSISRASLPNNKQRNSPTDVPLFILGRFAVDLNYQGTGMGAQLLRDSIARTIVASEQVAAKFLRVDAKDMNVASFYEHFGFVADSRNPLALYLKLPKSPVTGVIPQ